MFNLKNGEIAAQHERTSPDRPPLYHIGLYYRVNDEFSCCFVGISVMASFLAREETLHELHFFL